MDNLKNIKEITYSSEYVLKNCEVVDGESE